ncbi:c-type cytochrome [Agriterribacter sp.]|uniref:DUF7133 domain-containing protein n=1 Tax=Agriterribacter sp. TaxID=2821509 RepID=UPI002BAB2B79|nr:c-type cytochrome [Agriterribacter sp.]HRP56566.1 c-type cytochrome [Agriterribacter sp.]
MIKRRMECFPVFILVCLLVSCNTGESNIKPPPLDSLERKEILSNAPVLPPEKSLAAMEVEEGFEVRLVAAEPLISAPVALTFDDKGRIWVLEMEGYMPDTAGTAENRPNGKIIILEDKNGDGAADHRKVFMDSLVLPRALCLVEDGILVAAPPNLWYVEIKNDRPGKKVLVDGAYTIGDNVEHDANGLMRAMDNWVYNANSEKRYRKKGDHWITEWTRFRGQWGITQDDYGRLFYNNNSQNLLGDYFLPGPGAGNINQRSIPGYNVKIVENNRVYPARPTPGVNRGYMENILDDSLRLVNFTAACGPVIYRGGLFNEAYHNNAFVAEPSANLIKRNILEEEGYAVKGRQAYKGKEFLTSIDERFRPVNLYNGPDGALYITDMYRGIIQHKFYLTDYLKKEISKRSLSQPLNCGRIYKVVPKGASLKPVTMPADPLKLAALLQSDNGWIRDKAQQMLVDGKLTKAIPVLRSNLKKTDDPIPLIHSLWSLEGMEALQAQDVLPLLQNSNNKIRVQAITALPAVLNKTNYDRFVPVLQQMIHNKDSIAAPYIAFRMRAIEPFNKSLADELLMSLAKAFPGNPFVSGAIISNLENREKDFYKRLTAFVPDTNLAIIKQFKKTIYNMSNRQIKKDTSLFRKQFPAGMNLFASTCQTCHGEDGNGIPALAPPLNNSEWVTGDRDKLIAIALYGLTGPVKVNKKLYRSPEINGEMPGLAHNKDITDEAIAQVLSYIRKNWNNNASGITRDEVIKVRQYWNERQQPFTAEELMKW